MNTNADRFLAAFNQVEGHLRRVTGEGPGTPFTTLVKLADSAVVRRYADELRDFAELRNAIVHNYGTESYILADPRDQAVERFERIRDAIVQPEGALPRFGGPVATVASGDSLAAALAAMGRHGYSQLPVYDQGTCQGLLTQRGIARWLADRDPAEAVWLTETTVATVLAYERGRDDLAFVSRHASMYEVLELFQRQLELGRSRLEAVLITESGQRDQKPLGIVTPLDAVALL